MILNYINTLKLENRRFIKNIQHDKVQNLYKQYSNTQNSNNKSIFLITKHGKAKESDIFK